jgi:hypothetical protein
MANIPNIPTVLESQTVFAAAGCWLADSNYSHYSHDSHRAKLMRGDTHHDGAALPGAAVYLYSKIIIFLLSYKSIGI